MVKDLAVPMIQLALSRLARAKVGVRDAP